MNGDIERFNFLMKLQKERSRGLTHFSINETPETLVAQILPKEYSGEFQYDIFESVKNAKNIRFQPGIDSDKLPSFFFVVRGVTPFYPESGGQVGDSGEIVSNGIKGRIRDTKKEKGFITHFLDSGTTFQRFKSIANEITLRVDVPRRFNIMRNHTATHIVHEALRRVLGDHAHQQGSLVAPDHLRFDFNHFDKISPEELKAIEDMVNEKIAEAITVNALNDPKDWVTIEEAKRRYPNIKMFFGDKYGDRVRIVEIDPKFSVELCGGTHVKNTKEVGLFKIISESSIASGIRRIEAVTGEGLQRYIDQRLKKIGQLDEHLTKLLEEKEKLEKELGMVKEIEPIARTSLGTVSLPAGESSLQVLNHVEHSLRQREEILQTLTKTTNDLKKELSKVRVKEASSLLDSIVARGVSLNGFKVVSGKIKAGDMEELKSLGDTLRSKLSSGVGVLGAVVDEKVVLVCVVTDDLIRSKNLQAGKIVGEIAKGVGGSGGGRPHLATAGGKDVAMLDEVLRRTPSIVESMLKK